ncbi:hypothetical protein BC835DRAFT_1310690 [Cytidiella melzeri]|nr:hypothetical protein BC835DRAFT_1310690 [Cytidiella melzeri]
MSFATCVPWGLEAWSAKAKAFQVDSSEGKKRDTETLRKYFGSTYLGDLNEPSVIVDQHGQVLVWVLPRLLFQSKKDVGKWLRRIRPAEYVLNAATCLAAPTQFLAGMKMVHNRINGVGVEATYSQSGFWPSVFSGIAVIDQDCKLDLPDIGASVRYHPGDACFIAGNALQHEVKDWKGGDRLAYAHYHRFLVAERMGINPGAAPFLSDFGKHLDTGFLGRNANMYGQ